jgi:polyphosphate glucokinase
MAVSQKERAATKTAARARRAKAPVRRTNDTESPSSILAIDVGGTSVKLLASGHHTPIKIRSGKSMTPAKLVRAVSDAASEWEFDGVSIGYPGLVGEHGPHSEPLNLGPGWVGFDFAAAFGKPVKIINDAAMQALGSYDGRRMLFLGLGTGLGSTLIVDGAIVPMELGHLPYRKATFEDYVGERGQERYGLRRWRKRVADVVARLQAALLPDEVVLGGGNVRALKALPPGCRAGDNANAFAGGFRLWSDTARARPARKTRGQRT